MSFSCEIFLIIKTSSSTEDVEEVLRTQAEDEPCAISKIRLEKQNKNQSHSHSIIAD